MLEEDKVVSGKNEAVSYNFNSKVKHFHKDVRKVISMARREGFGTACPVPYLDIEVTDFNIKTNLKTLKAKSKIKQSEHSLPFSNYENLVIKSEDLL